jgi:hypothetical protein
LRGCIVSRYERQQTQDQERKGWMQVGKIHDRASSVRSARTIVARRPAGQRKIFAPWRPLNS